MRFQTWKKPRSTVLKKILLVFPYFSAQMLVNRLQPRYFSFISAFNQLNDGFTATLQTQQKLGLTTRSLYCYYNLSITVLKRSVIS
jgi:hypothetical protein